MIDQNILYSECPCGSGKKFKFCCYPIVRGELPKEPSRADVTEAIRRRSQSARLAENYRLPQRIHPDAYMAWCRVEMRYYDLVGDKKRLRNVLDGMELVQKQFGRKDD